MYKGFIRGMTESAFAFVPETNPRLEVVEVVVSRDQTYKPSEFQACQLVYMPRFGWIRAHLEVLGVLGSIIGVPFCRPRVENVVPDVVFLRGLGDA